MPFRKGSISNPAGRQKGTPNKVKKSITEDLLAGMHKFLKKNMRVILTDLETPEAREKARIYCDLLKYAVPRLRPRSGEVRFEDMTPEQLQELLGMLQENSLPQVIKGRR